MSCHSPRNIERVWISQKREILTEGWSGLQPVDGELIDSLMVLFALVYNGCIAFLFVARALERGRLESLAGYVVNLLLVPFSILWVLNLLCGSEVGRLITGMPIILFLLYDLWYRTISREKPKHHPRRWPIELYVYLILFFFGSILLVGYAFLISLFDGFIVLAVYYASLAAYGYYQYKYRKTQT